VAVIEFPGRRQVEFYRLTGIYRRAGRRAAAAATTRTSVPLGSQRQATPKIPEWERIANAVSRTPTPRSGGELNTAAALAALDTDVDATLEKRRWMMRCGRNQ
jgi:multiple sugar transport system substrate-binding protein